MGVPDSRAAQARTCYYSFPRASHGYEGDVSLEFGNGSDNFQVRMVVGQKNAIVDLGAVDWKSVRRPETAEQRATWSGDRIAAVVGHTYLEYLQDQEDASPQGYVKFKVLAMQPGEWVLILWEKLPE